MDVRRFQSQISQLINGGSLKGTDIEKAKKERGLAQQAGPQADTVEINFARLAGIEQESGGHSEVASLIQDISNMSLAEAKAAFKNPDIAEKLVDAGVLE